MLPISTRFPNGVTNVLETHGASDFKAPWPFKYHGYANDFDSFAAGDWTVSETQAGATQDLVAGDGGRLALVNSAANADVNSIQLRVASFALDPTKDVLVSTRVQVDDATLAAMLVGIAIVDTSPIASAPSDGVWFGKAAGVTTLTFNVSKASTVSSVNIGTMASATMVELTAQWNAVTAEWLVYVNNAQAGRISGSTNFPNTQNLTVTIAVANGSGVARTLTCDWIMAAAAR